MVKRLKRKKSKKGRDRVSRLDRIAAVVKAIVDNSLQRFADMQNPEQAALNEAEENVRNVAKAGGPYLRENLKRAQKNFKRISHVVKGWTDTAAKSQRQTVGVGTDDGAGVGVGRGGVGRHRFSPDLSDYGPLSESEDELFIPDLYDREIFEESTLPPATSTPARTQPPGEGPIPMQPLDESEEGMPPGAVGGEEEEDERYRMPAPLRSDDDMPRMRWASPTKVHGGAREVSRDQNPNASAAQTVWNTSRTRNLRMGPLQIEFLDVVSRNDAIGFSGYNTTTPFQIFNQNLTFPAMATLGDSLKAGWTADEMIQEGIKRQLAPHEFTKLFFIMDQVSHLTGIPSASSEDIRGYARVNRLNNLEEARVRLEWNRYMEFVYNRSKLSQSGSGPGQTPSRSPRRGGGESSFLIPKLTRTSAESRVDNLAGMLASNPDKFKKALNLHGSPMQLWGKEIKHDTGLWAEGVCTNDFFKKHLKKFQAMGIDKGKFDRLVYLSSPSMTKELIGLIQIKSVPAVRAAMKRARAAARRNKKSIWTYFLQYLRKPSHETDTASEKKQ